MAPPKAASPSRSLKLSLPIRYVGIEKSNDVMVFDPAKYVKGLFTKMATDRTYPTPGCLSFAAQGTGPVSPNPLVGCVIVSSEGVNVGDGTYI